MSSQAAKDRAVRRGPGFFGFLLAHHYSNELDRCYQIWLGKRPIWICARCAGVYPVLLVVLTAQLVWPIPPSSWDWFFLFGLPLPALIDWGTSRISGRAGSNVTRTVSGGALGASLGRTIYYNMTNPLNRMVMIQLLCLAGTVVAVELVARLVALLKGADSGSDNQ